MSPRLSSVCGHRDGLFPSILIVFLLALVAVLPEGDLRGHVSPGQQPGYHQKVVPSDEVVPGVVVIKLKRTGVSMKGTAAQSAGAALQTFSSFGVTSLKRMFPQRVPLSDSAIAAGRVDLSQIHCAAIPSDLNPVEVAAQLAALPGVEYAEPRYNYRLCDVPNDSEYVSAQQVYLDRMHVAEGWTIQKGSRDVVIATVDGGTNWQHPDLAANMWINSGEDLNHSGAFEKMAASAGGDLDGVDNDHNGHVDDVIGWNFGSADSCDPRGFLPSMAAHGTGTASDFGAVTDNHRGMAGTSWNCRVMAVCVSHATVDNNPCYWLEGLEYASRMGARVINCSFYRAGGPDNPLQHEQDVITAATEQGALIVAAAGNNNGQNLDSKPWYPASYFNVLSVGATRNNSDEIASFTNLGLNVSVFAPGVAIRVAKDDGSYGTDQGTSHSSPLVAGLAGLLFSKHPDWTPEMVAEQIRMTSDPIDAVNPDHAGQLGHGRANFYRALSEVHAGIVVEAYAFHNASRGKFFMDGDTVILGIRMKNVLNARAENLQFNIAADAGLKPLGLTHSPTRLDAGAADSLVALFVVPHLTREQDATVRVGWSANGNEQDARLFVTKVYAGDGYWERQMSPAWSELDYVYPVDNNVVWAIGWLWGEPRSTVLRTTDGGDNWVLMSRPSLTFMFCFSPVDSLHAWANGATNVKADIYATDDGGRSWSPQPYPDPQAYYFSGFRFFDAANGYAFGNPFPSQGGKYVILRTTDGGAHWTHINNEPGGPGGQDISINAIWCTDRQHIWFGTGDARIWYTSDGGESWSNRSIGTSSVNSLVMRDDSVGILSAGRAWKYQPLLLLRTRDGWRTWETLPTAMPGDVNAVAFPTGSTDVWVAGGHSVAHSSDEGASWTLQPSDPFSISALSMSFFDRLHGWMVTDQGQILCYHVRSVISGVTLRRDESSWSRALLEQNYPNPFNPLTTIKYTVGGPEWQVAGETGTRVSGPAPSGVEGCEARKTRLVVYDLLGREVATLVNEVKGPGSYEVMFDGTNLSSGVYFYRLRVGSFVETKKLLLVR